MSCVTSVENHSLVDQILTEKTLFLNIHTRKFESLFYHSVIESWILSIPSTTRIENNMLKLPKVSLSKFFLPSRGYPEIVRKYI